MHLKKGVKITITFLQHRDKSKIGMKLTGVIVDILPALKAPCKTKILKYYGRVVEDPKYAAVFGPNKSDRIVIKTHTGYGIYPMLGLGRYFNMEHYKEKTNGRTNETPNS